MIKCVIDRDKWLRTVPETGKSFDDSRHCLLNDFRMRCCLGFACLAVGVSDETMRPYDTPDALPESDDIAMPLVRIQTEAIDANDEPHLHGIETSADQERRITELFATAGLDVEFIN